MILHPRDPKSGPSQGDNSDWGVDGGEASVRVRYVSGDGWDRGGIGFARPPIIGKKSVTKPYLESTWVRTALKALSQPFSRLPLRLWDRDPKERGAQEIVDHPLARIWKKPNTLLLGEDLFKIHIIGYRLTGATYLFLANDVGKPVDAGEVPTQIIPVMRTGVKVESKDAFGLPASYSYSFSKNGKPIIFPKEAVIPIIDHNPYDWTQGFGDVEVLASEIDTAHQALRYLAAFVRSGGDPGAWFKFKNKLSEPEAHRLQTEADDQYGALGVSRYKVVSGDIEDIIPNAVKPRDLEYEKLLTRQRDVTLSTLGVPPPLAGVFENSTYNNMVVAERIMWTGPNGILSDVRTFESKLNGFFLPRFITAAERGGSKKSLRVRPEWTYRFDTSQVETLREAKADEIKLAAEIAARGIGVSMAEMLEMLGVEINSQDQPEGVDALSGLLARWVSHNLRVGEDRAGESVAKTLAGLAQMVALGEVPAEAARRIAVATLPGTISEAAAADIFPEPPKIPKGDDPKAGAGDGDASGTASGPGDGKNGHARRARSQGKDSRNARGEKHACSAPVNRPQSEQADFLPLTTYAFQPGKSIRTDRRLAIIVEEWLDEYERATLEKFEAIAANAGSENGRLTDRLTPKTVHAEDVFDVERSALDSYILAKEIWAALLADTAGPRIEQLFLDALAASQEDLGGAFISATDPRVLEALRKRNLSFVGITETLTEQIRDILAAALVDTVGPVEPIIARKLPELTEALRQVFGTKEARANAIARTETGGAQNSAYFLQAQEANADEIGWVHSGNPNGRPEHIAIDRSGERVKLGSRFSNGLRYPHDPDGDASQNANCGCSFKVLSFREEE